jgi:hypothetical protein
LDLLDAAAQDGGDIMAQLERVEATLIHHKKNTAITLTVTDRRRRKWRTWWLSKLHT